VVPLTSSVGLFFNKLSNNKHPLNRWIKNGSLVPDSGLKLNRKSRHLNSRKKVINVDANDRLSGLSL